MRGVCLCLGGGVEGCLSVRGLAAGEKDFPSSRPVQSVLKGVINPLLKVNNSMKFYITALLNSCFWC